MSENQERDDQLELLKIVMSRVKDKEDRIQLLVAAETFFPPRTEGDTFFIGTIMASLREALKEILEKIEKKYGEDMKAAGEISNMRTITREEFDQELSDDEPETKKARKVTMFDPNGGNRGN